MSTRVKLTKAVLDRLDLDKEGQWVTDTEVPQLLVRLTPTSKTFVARWTSKNDGKRKQVTVEQVGMVSIDEARNRVRKLVAADTNPTVETLADIYKIWDTSYASAVGERHAIDFRSSWSLHIGPDLGKKKLSRLTPDALQDWYAKKRAEHPTTPKGKVRDKPFSAATVNRWVAYLSKLLAIARRGGHMTGNPIEGLEKATPRRRLDTFTLEDIRDLGDNLTAVQDKYPIGVAVIRFLMLTPCRGIEARELEWDDLDLRNGTWTIPADRYKTDEDKVFPIGPVQADYLNSLPRWSSKFVFPAPKDEGAAMRYEHQRDVWERVRPKKLGAHALRKTIATALLNRDVPLEAVSKLLGHSSTAVTQQAYAHLSPQSAGKHLATWHQLWDDQEEADAENADPEMVELLQFQAAQSVKKFNKE